MPAGSGIDITSSNSLLFSNRESIRPGKAWIHLSCFLISYWLNNRVEWDFLAWMDPRLLVGILWFLNRGDSNGKTPLSQIRNRKDYVEIHDHLPSGEIFNFCKGMTKIATIPSTHWEWNSLPSKNGLRDSFANPFSTPRRSSLFFLLYQCWLATCEESHTLLGCKPRRLM